MKYLFLLLALNIVALASGAQTKGSIHVKDSTKKVQVVEAACGQCRLGLAGEDCDLAVRINGAAYYVDGTHIDEHGNAHATDGFCNAVRKAEVQGEVVNHRFKATYFKLLPEAKDKKKPKS